MIFIPYDTRIPSHARLFTFSNLPTLCYLPAGNGGKLLADQTAKTNKKANLSFKTRKKDCEKLLKIRNALLDECDKYVLGLDETCSTAVMIAYRRKSRNC